MLEKYRKEILTCTGCAFCKKACQVYLATRTETDSPKGRIMIAFGLLSGEIKEDESIVKAMHRCALCRLCESVCPSMVKIGDIIKAARHDLSLLPEHEKLISEIESWDEKVDGRRIFIGWRNNEIVDATAEKIGAIPYHGGCGAPIERLGRENEFGLRLRETFGDAEVFYYEPECKKYFPEGRSIIDAIESIDIDGRVMLHIPHDFDEESREKIISLFKGKEFEIIDKCCGGRIEFSRVFPDDAKKMAMDIIKEAEEKNAKIVTVSLECYEHLKKYGNVVDLLEIAKFSHE